MKESFNKSWLWILLLGASVIVNGTFFLQIKDLQAKIDSKMPIIDPEKTTNVDVLRDELISSQKELRQCIVQLMAVK